MLPINAFHYISYNKILGNVELLIFYIRHYVGQLCGAQRPFGLVGDRLRLLLKTAVPRQLVSLCYRLLVLTVTPIIPGLKKKQESLDWNRVFAVKLLSS